MASATTRNNLPGNYVRLWHLTDVDADAQHVTQYQEGELYAAGPFPNQGKTVAGLPEFVKDAASPAKQDVVVWYTTGYTHVARPEDFPVMPAETIGFRLVPRGSRAIPPSTSPIRAGRRFRGAPRMSVLPTGGSQNVDLGKALSGYSRALARRAD